MYLGYKTVAGAALVNHLSIHDLSVPRNVVHSEVFILTSNRSTSDVF